MRSLKVLLILGNLEGMISFEKKPEGIHVNHALKHRNNGEIRGDHSVNRSAYINHIHDKSSRERNPSRCHSQAEKSTGHSYSQRCHFPHICICVFLRSLCEVTTGVPSSARARLSLWIRPFSTETSKNSFR